MKSEHDLRQEVIRFGHLCYERRLLVAMDGNLSVRLPSGDILCTRTGCHKGFLCEEDLLVVDRQGRRKRGSGEPTSETAMHLACYEARPDVQAVIHAHPPLCVAFTIAKVSMARSVLPEVVLTLGTIPTAPYETTGTPALAETIRRFVKDYDAILMDTHGALAVGRGLLEAFCRLETMEHTAQVMKAAHDLGGIRNLPPEEAARLRQLGMDRYGARPPAPTPAGMPGAAAGTRPGVRMVRLSEVPLQPTLGEIQEALRRQREAGPQPEPAGMADVVAEEVARYLRGE